MFPRLEKESRDCSIVRTRTLLYIFLSANKNTLKQVSRCRTGRRNLSFGTSRGWVAQLSNSYLLIRQYTSDNAN